MDKFARVKDYYNRGVWTIDMVRNSFGRWITAEQFKEITGEDYE